MCLEHNRVIFKAGERWFHLLVSLGDPACVRLLYLLWSQPPRAVRPRPAARADAVNREPTAVAWGARNPRPPPRRGRRS